MHTVSHDCVNIFMIGLYSLFTFIMNLLNPKTVDFYVVNIIFFGFLSWLVNYTYTLSLFLIITITLTN